MRIAVIGTGIAGMAAAYLLAPDHDLVIFEANDYTGGHTHTIPISLEGRTYAVEPASLFSTSPLTPILSRC